MLGNLILMLMKVYRPEVTFWRATEPSLYAAGLFDRGTLAISGAVAAGAACIGFQHWRSFGRLTRGQRVVRKTRQEGLAAKPFGKARRLQTQAAGDRVDWQNHVRFKSRR